MSQTPRLSRLLVTLNPMRHMQQLFLGDPKVAPYCVDQVRKVTRIGLVAPDVLGRVDGIKGDARESVGEDRGYGVVGDVGEGNELEAVRVAEGVEGGVRIGEGGPGGDAGGCVRGVGFELGWREGR